MRIRSLLVTALTASVVVTGCSGEDEEPAAPAEPVGLPSASAGDPLAELYAQPLAWEDCDAFECTTVEVPLDYADPGGERIELALLRVPATDPDRRIGSLLVNPGGPGASGIDYARAAGAEEPDEAAVSPELRARYDVVGFDPRGVGRSTPVDCVDDEQLSEFVAADGSPDDPAEVAEVGALGDRFVAGCAERSGRLLPHVGTASVARDLDLLRSVLGDEQLHYLGLSYGTLIGATYAELFPQRVGRVVLDGVVDPSQGVVESALGQARGFEDSFARFVDACLAEDCPLGASREEVLTRVDELLAELDAEPLSTDLGRELTQSLGVLGIVLPLYLEKSQGYPVLQQALATAFEGDGTLLMLLADAYLGRAEDGSYEDNQNEAFIAVNCIDTVTPPEAELPALAAQFAAASPRFGPFLVYGNGGLSCADWPAQPQPVPAPVRAAGAAPILVVGTTGDPATPYDQAVTVADQLESGVLLTVEGDVHTAYRSAGSACADSAIDAYLLEGTVPAEGTRC